MPLIDDFSYTPAAIISRLCQVSIKAAVTHMVTDYAADFRYAG